MTPLSHTGFLLSRAGDRLRQLGLHPRKRWGQNFLVDTAVLEEIISAADLSPADIVVEVGPGLGVLTEGLIRNAGKVICIEVDAALAGGLSRYFADKPNFTLINADVLNVKPGDLFTTGKTEYKVVANIPYYITAPILRHFLEASVKPRLMVVMVQKEVAQSIAAARGDMAVLSIAVQFYGRPSIVSYVPARSFYPRPKVDSAILKIEVYTTPAVEVADPEAFFAAVRAGFSAPRKQLRNSLAQGLNTSVSEASAFLHKADIDPKQRPEDLSLEQWAALYRSLPHGVRMPSHHGGRPAQP
ncbi:MAG: ribosomal RNA small subunit methyltransferase A [Chloroflexi bacterium]|nr:ribosomal RNA small subunit methyltransferase A [Chloroflexota bacterium]